MKLTNLVFILLVMVFGACSKVLDTEPQATISDEAVIVDEKSAQAALIGTYDALQGYIGGTIVALDLAGDNVVNFNSQNNLVANKTAASGGGGFSSMYTTINRANFVINKLPALAEGTISTAARNQILGEAYFLRGLVYFDLARVYGGAPIVLEPAVSPTSHKGIKRSTQVQTYAQAQADLDKAEALLTEKVDRNRANKFTVYALKARLYLYTQRWELAEEYASKVIAASSFSLVKPFSNFYTGKNTTESIFEIAFSSADRSSFYTNWLSPAQGGRHDYIPAREFVGLLLDPQQGGSRKSLLFQTPEGVYDLIQYGKQDGTSSIYVLRIAEQYLIRAEARAKKTSPDLPGAIADLNVIKARADVPVVNYSPSFSKQDILLLVEKERRLELPFEGHRFTDIVRTGRAGEVFGAINPNLKNEQFWIFPIPQTEIIQDPDLEQNPGY
ncbi:RagB/SusD family nutrient uptake outer membrane protein [Segetibacter sp. 3557_3]|uniref:RagB/SusD family nutrient uptake outer membrane protein n=1 Tax=Segetibacter sp. 3557_3 TaxID=2547429 RepID=UPI001058D475|nr:RagB/SusD family nutrient uptake outer membrane protein [Segetibacter sp. 3557_3]TDH24540.1 RagB/SusD family nutrient uptake outer membrane protein [Segetibacter sp. 3557_3]